MATNFSVAWLCQSSQPDCRSGLEAALVHSHAALALQTKHASHILNDGNVKDVTKIPSSPTSKHSNTNLTGHPCASESCVLFIFFH